MPGKVKHILCFIVGTVAFVALLAILDQLGPSPATADSGSGTGFYGNVTYTCNACPRLPRDCWRAGDKVEVLTYPDKYPTQVSSPIIKTGSRSGAYINLIPPDAGNWYLQGQGTLCGSEYYLVFWSGYTQTIRQDINMQYSTNILGPQN